METNNTMRRIDQLLNSPFFKVIPVLLLSFFFFYGSEAYAEAINKKAIKKWFKQHDYLFTEDYFNGKHWLQLNYMEKYDIVEDYYEENNLEMDVRKGLLTLDLMFHLDDGIYQQYSVYAILDKIIAEMFREETQANFYSSASG